MRALATEAANAIWSSQPGADGVLRLTGAELGKALPAYGSPVTDSLSCYLQVVTGTDPSEVVLNQIVSGYGRASARLVRQIGHAGAAEPISSWQAVKADPDGALLAESEAGFGNNLNLRAPTTTLALDYPSSRSLRDPAQLVRLSDLAVRHDRQAAELHLIRRSDERRIRPVLGGGMGEVWLPVPMRHLVEIFGVPPSFMRGGVSPLPPPPPALPLTEHGRVFPRLTVGRVTIARRCWVFPAAALPARGPGEVDTSYWLKLAGWIADRGLPERFFVRAGGNGMLSSSPFAKSRKPFFVDMAAWSLVVMLERALAHGGTVIITEALPDLSRAPRYGGDGHVTELIVELPAQRSDG
jgi:hypothetical protein